jgi:aromatic-L-amino-acid/L-tryptophan decarboxylase
MQAIPSLTRRPSFPLRRKMPNEVRERHLGSVSREGEEAMAVFEEFKRFIRPYGSGNIHPGFMGWVQGGAAPPFPSL